MILFSRPVRFINEGGKIEEHAIDVVEAHDRSAQGLLELLTTCLATLGIPLDGIVSQCYDGASVMSGHRGGLQTLLSIKCGRVVLYIHCTGFVYPNFNTFVLVNE